MILVNGCSYSSGYDLDDWQNNRYSYFISKKLKKFGNVWNISSSSQTNDCIIWQLESYINHSLINDSWEKPNIVVCQLTDDYRQSVPHHRASGTWKPNDFLSLVNGAFNGVECGPEYTKRFKKLTITSIHNNIKKKKDWYENRKKIVRDPIRIDKKLKFIRNNLGMGTLVVHSMDESMELMDFPDNGPDKYTPIGDETGIYNNLRTASSLLSLQRLCDQENIKLVVLNFFGWQSLLLEDPVFQLINENNFIVKNGKTWGMYNQLEWRNFNKTEDGHHWNVDAQAFIADSICDHVLHDKQLDPIENTHPDYDDTFKHLQTYDYT